MEFLKKLAEILGVKATEREVEEAVNDAVELRKGLSTTLKAAKTTTKSLLEAAEEVVSDALSSADGLKTVLRVVGVEDADAAIEKITDLLAQAAELKEAAVNQGMITMRRDGMLKAKDGGTTVSEVLRSVFTIN